MSLISVIVPVYKVEQYLVRCVDSIINQTYKNIEVILIDDGSPDNCGSICDRYALEDKRIRAIHKENGGLSDARNAGLAIARGEYIAFVDSDDWIESNYLLRMYETIIETQSDICECGILKTIGEEVHRKNNDMVPVVYRTAEALKRLICDNTFHQYVWNKLYHRDVVGDIRFPKGKINEDEFWTYQVFGNAQKIAKIPDVLYYYFQRPNSIMGTTYSVKRLDAIEAKVQRQLYIKEKFPELEEIAKLNLFGSCVYAGQMSLMHLSKEEIMVFKNSMKDTLETYKPSLGECLRAKGSNRIWYMLARNFFWKTCRLKCLLKKGL